jgi:hypothetical protein
MHEVFIVNKWFLNDCGHDHSSAGEFSVGIYRLWPETGSPRVLTTVAR